MLPKEFDATLLSIGLSAVTKNHQQKKTISLELHATLGESLESEMGQWSTMVDVVRDATAKSMVLETDGALLEIELATDGPFDGGVVIKNATHVKMSIKAVVSADDEREVVAKIGLDAPFVAGQLDALVELLGRDARCVVRRMQTEMFEQPATPTVRRRRRTRSLGDDAASEQPSV